MVNIIKKSRASSVTDLAGSLRKFIALLDGQKEDAAAADLRIALGDIESYQLESVEFQGALDLLVEAFEGEHELNAYTFKRDKNDGKWSPAEELYLVSTSLLNIVKRLKKK